MNFYALNIAYAFICLFIYVSFRMGIGSYLRYKKNSKTFIRKNKNGFLNYWTYKKLHKEINLGYVYYLNLILVILTPVYFLVAISFGWSDVMRLPIGMRAGIQPAHSLAMPYLFSISEVAYFMKGNTAE